MNFRRNLGISADFLFRGSPLPGPPYTRLLSSKLFSPNLDVISLHSNRIFKCHSHKHWLKVTKSAFIIIKMVSDKWQLSIVRIANIRKQISTLQFYNEWKIPITTCNSRVRTRDDSVAKIVRTSSESSLVVVRKPKRSEREIFVREFRLLLCCVFVISSGSEIHKLIFFSLLGFFFLKLKYFSNALLLIYIYAYDNNNKVHFSDILKFTDYNIWDWMLLTHWWN